MRSKLSLPLLNAHQTAKKLVSHPNFHGGSIETTDSNNIIELNNFSEFGPKKASGDFGSVDSSEFLGTWAFPSQGSLANIELLAAQGSMGPNGSINNSVYVNPFEPGRDGRRRQVFRESPGSPRRRKRMSSRSRSTDLAELDGTRETSLREGRGPNHKRPRGNQGPWVVDVEEYCFEGAHRSSNLSSNMPAAAAAASTNANMSAKIAAALNQGFSTLGGRLVAEQTYSIVE